MRIFQALKKLFLTSRSDIGISNHQDGESKMTKEVAKNYTEAQEARLAEFDVIDNDLAIELAAELGKDVRSIRAKAVRMGLYKAKDKVSKAGGKIESKEAIVADIAALVGKNLDGLEKAPKLVLQTLRTRLSA
jgi:glucose-6-phosphate-specific signal transduction histidine kinase